MVREHLPSYRRYLEARGYAKLTARDYRAKVKRFLTWQEGRPLTEAELRAYRAHLRAHQAPASVRGSLAALSLFFAFLERTGVARGLPSVPAPLDPQESRQGRRPVVVNKSAAAASLSVGRG